MSCCQGSWLYDCFVLNRCQTTQPSLSTTSVIRPLDPRHNRDPQLVSGRPSAAVEHVLLQQREEALHRCVIARRADSSHRPDDAVTGQSPSEFLRSELAAAVAMRHASAHVTTPGHGHLEGIDSQPGLHPRTDRIADDARRVGVAVSRSQRNTFIRMVLRNVGQPQLIRAISSKLVPGLPVGIDNRA